MKIKKIQLKNGYKRFHDLTIDLGNNPKRIIALVGPNGCGKSSVLDGLLYITNSHGQIGNTGIKNYNYHSLEGLPNFDYRSIIVEFENDNYQNTRRIKQQTGKENTIFSFRSPYRYNSNLKITSSQATSEIRLNSYGASTSTDLDDKMVENYRRLYIKYNKYLNDTNSKPSEAKKKIIGDLNNSLENCLDLKITSIGDIESDQGTLYFNKNDHLKDFEFNVLSSGEKEVVDILLDLYLRQEEYNDTVFLIDEPELHINTSIQKKLLLEINKLVGKDCQIWVATHSIGFLRALQDDLKDQCQIIEFKKEMKPASQVYTLEPIKLTRSNWQNIFTTALDDLTTLLAPKEIIYCEGSLNGSLDEKMFNSIFYNKYSDSLFVASTNKVDCERYAAIALTILNKAFSGVKIKVVTDRDDDLTIPKISHVKILKLKRREFENYLYDFEIMSKAFPFIKKNDYQIICKNILNDDVKSKTPQFMKLCKISSKKNFKLKLSQALTEDTHVFKELESIIFNIKTIG